MQAFLIVYSCCKFQIHLALGVWINYAADFLDTKSPFHHNALETLNSNSSIPISISHYAERKCKSYIDKFYNNFSRPMYSFIRQQHQYDPQNWLLKINLAYLSYCIEIFEKQSQVPVLYFIGWILNQTQLDQANRNNNKNHRNHTNPLMVHRTFSAAGE